MKLPNAHTAEVPDRKLTGYLLDEQHPQNQGKAAFYAIGGFTLANPDELRSALLSHIATHEITKIIITDFGTRYVVEGLMSCPNGKQYPIRSVWFVDNGSELPKLVTVYPN
jgi:hypothetical protein